jgi:hypothetical protein
VISPTTAQEDGAMIPSRPKPRTLSTRTTTDSQSLRTWPGKAQEERSPDHGRLRPDLRAETALDQPLGSQ